MYVVMCPLSLEHLVSIEWRKTKKDRLYNSYNKKYVWNKTWKTVFNFFLIILFLFFSNRIWILELYWYLLLEIKKKPLYIICQNKPRKLKLIRNSSLLLIVKSYCIIHSIKIENCSIVCIQWITYCLNFEYRDKSIEKFLKCVLLSTLWTLYFRKSCEVCLEVFQYMCAWVNNINNVYNNVYIKSLLFWVIMSNVKKKKCQSWVEMC